MKNLPDKIYLNFGEITKEEFETGDYNEFCKLDEFAVTFWENRVYDTDVEYIRKDSIIEWLKDCSTYKDFNGNTYVDKDLFNTMVEDLKKYMED